MALAVVVMAGCAKGPKTPEQAFLKLERAVAAGDGAGAYEVLDQPTQWAVQSTLKDQRLQRTIISAKYPEAEAQKALAQLRAAEETDPAQFFKRVDDERHVVQAYRKRLGAVSGPIKSKIDGPDTVWVVRQQDGMPFRFAKNRDGTWGWSELRGDWELEKDRAQHAVKTVQENAKLYQKTEGQ
ncbi:MAG: hypothetical protein JWN44_3416 [Myxococcales bacterium]|nr:hypothetical protein [Myxococcales bacterium]